MKRRKQKNSLKYKSLEERRVLASMIHFDPAVGTIYIRAEAAVGANYASDFAVHVDQVTDEVVVNDFGHQQKRFPVPDVSHISYEGTALNDRFLNKTDLTSRIVGLGGDDYLQGGNSADRIIAGNGDDVVYGGHGNDYLAGGAGDDQLLENRTRDSGSDRVFGGPGIDIIETGVGNDIANGGAGHDTIRGGDGADILLGSDGNDTIEGGDGQDRLFGNDGNDTINGNAAADRIFGHAGDDTLHGDAGADFMIGGDGDDGMFGGFGNDRIVGNDGNDVLNGNEGLDRIFAAVPTVSDSPFGFDLVDGGVDQAADVIVAHANDNVTQRVNDSVVDSSVARARQQAAFLESNKTQPGWIETDSGLQIKHIVQGTGDSPVATDRVRVNYTGRFTDGSIFDTNTNGPIEFPLNGVIAGWTEGLQLMNVGGTAELAIPAHLGYGSVDRGSIPANSTLLFTVELLAIV